MPEQPFLQCLVVDDEPPARSLLNQYIADMPGLTWLGECGNAMEAIAFLQQHPVDLVFLDICMPQLQGNELVKALVQPPAIIFTTAHPEYAVESYELDATDFLLKPIRFDRFVKAVNKVMRLPQVPVPNTTSVSEAFVYFRVDRKMMKVFLADILFVESMKDYLKVHTSKEVLVTKMSMHALESMLPSNQFIRVHRSFVVGIRHIRSYTHEVIELGATEIPIGKMYRGLLPQAVDAI